MKTKLLLLLLLANFSIYAQTNLVTNGNFEIWNGSTPQNWNVINGATSSNDASEGQFSAKLSYTVLSPKIVTQVLLKAGVTYVVKYKYKYLNANYGGDHPISLKISQNGSSSSLSSNVFATNNSWTQKETDFTPDSNMLYDLSFSTFSFDSDAFDVLIDDVQMYDPNSPQYTLIPDLNFEDALINLGIDNVHDGKVLTSSAKTVTTLDITNYPISNLSGIEDFINLTNLSCRTDNLTSLNISNNTKLKTLRCSGSSGSSTTRGSGKLTSLNVSKNTLLTILDCGSNQITNLDITQNTLLETLICAYNRIPNLDTSNNTLLNLVNCGANEINMLDFSNSPSLKILRTPINKLTSINISNNKLLTDLDCISNLLSSLDISKNPALTRILCGSNKNLSSLNLKNGANKLLQPSLAYIMFWDNPNLKCIEVDDVAYSEANWSNVKDASASYSTNCTLGLENSVFDKVVIYPNPTKGEITINNASLEKATVYNSLGQLVRTFNLDSSNTINSINLSGLSKGIYYIYLINQDAASAKKVIVE